MGGCQRGGPVLHLEKRRGEEMAERGGEALHLCRYEKILGGGTEGKAPESAPGGICSD